MAPTITMMTIAMKSQSYHRHLIEKRDSILLLLPLARSAPAQRSSLLAHRRYHSIRMPQSVFSSEAPIFGDPLAQRHGEEKMAPSGVPFPLFAPRKRRGL